MMDNWEGDRRRGASLSATQLAAAEVKFRQNIALLNLSSQYWLIIRQANTALHSPTALSWTPRRRGSRMWRLWVWRLKYWDGHELGLASCQRRIQIPNLFHFFTQNLLSISQYLLNNKSGDFQVEDNLLKMFGIKDWINLTIYQMINDKILWGDSNSENCLFLLLR